MLCLFVDQKALAITLRAWERRVDADTLVTDGRDGYVLLFWDGIKVSQVLQSPGLSLLPLAGRKWPKAG